MIGTIRKHNKLLWWIIIPITIGTFVYYFLPTNRYGTGDAGSRGGDYGAINGEPITADQMQKAMREAQIFYRLNHGEWPQGTEEVSRQLRQIATERLILAFAADEYHISVPTEAAARYIRQMLGVKPEDNVPAAKIVETLTKLGTDDGVTMDDFDRFARHQVAQEYLIALVGMNGKLSTPQEFEVFYRRENQPIVAEMVTFPAKNYEGTSKPSEKELEDFYTKQQANYRVPDKIAVEYVYFNVTNYMAATEKQLSTNLNDIVEQDYTQRGADAFKDENGKSLSPADAKARLRQQIILSYAAVTAHKEANTFLKSLSDSHNEQHPYSLADFSSLAQSNNLVVKTTPLFDMQEPPRELPIAAQSARVLFSLRNDDPDDKEHAGIFAPSALEGRDGYYVVALKERVSSRIQPLAEVRDKVAADYKSSAALEKAGEAGKRFEQAIQAGMSQGKTFDTMAAAQFVRPTQLTPFSLATTSIPDISEKAQFEQVQDLAGRMHPGQFSPFMPTTDGGYILYLKGYLPVDETKMKTELPVFVDRMRDKFQIAAFSAWFNKEYRSHFVPPASATANPVTGG